MADSANYIYTVGGYAALAGVGYAIYHVSTSKKRAAIQAKSNKTAQPESKKEDRKKKQRMESFTSENQESSAKASKAKSYAKVAEPSAPEVAAPAANIKDDEPDNAEFAKQLSKAKQGKQFAAGSSDNKKKKAKSVKQSRANNIDAPAPEKPSVQSASSNNGGDADADDDQSATQSPIVEAADASGVADMLEPAAAAPSVLRLTATEPKDNKKKKAAKAPEPVETKKQRQNRKKAEASKAAREESEKERKVLEEKQRRAARVGEGRVAKDGSQYTNAAAAKSAWKEGAPNGNKAEPVASEPSHGLLDTGDEVKNEPDVKKEAPKSKPAQAPQSSGWTSSLPTEEEQMKMIEQEDEWSTVKSKASKKSARKEAPTSSGDEAPVKAATPAPAPAAPKAQQSATAPATNNKSKPKGPQSFGSFSALTSKDDPAEEEVEEEWEV